MTECKPNLALVEVLVYITGGRFTFPAAKAADGLNHDRM
jgi:hypothetical protein